MRDTSYFWKNDENLVIPMIEKTRSKTGLNWNELAPLNIQPLK
jgi:hypothetical protein